MVVGQGGAQGGVQGGAQGSSSAALTALGLQQHTKLCGGRGLESGAACAHQQHAPHTAQNGTALHCTAPHRTEQHSTQHAAHLLDVLLFWVRELTPALEAKPEVVKGVHLIGAKARDGTAVELGVEAGAAG